MRRGAGGLRYSLQLVVAIVLGAGICTALNAQSPKPASPSSFSRTIYLVRHGSYDAYAVGRDSEDGPGLTPLGVAQARLVAARLRGLPTGLTSLTASTMTRAQETARVMHETLLDLPVRATPALRECTPPTSIGGVNEREAHEAEDCKQRLEEAFTTYFVPSAVRDQSDVLVCHGNVIRYFVLRALGQDTRAWARLSVAHTSITVIRVTPTGRLIVLSVGDVGHLPPNLQSWGDDNDPQLVVPSSTSDAR